ncbi:MAG: sensor histidine kinase [Nocardioidaceae bacterium]
MLRFWQRWIFFILGGALFTPYAFFSMLVVPIAVPGFAELDSVVIVVLAFLLSGLTIVATSLLPVIRTVEGVVTPSLLGGEASGLVTGAARSTRSRIRGALWYTLHVWVGAAVSVASVIVIPFSVLLVVSALGFGGNSQVESAMGDVAVSRPLAAPLALLLGAVLVVVVLVLGGGAARLAPVLLGPDPEERIADLERRTTMLAERARLARELHDSIGHALTVTTLQASAARTVLHQDTAFVEQALQAIEQTGRVAAADLDNVLGLLRDESGARAPQLTLQDVDSLVASHRDLGLPVELDVSGDVSGVAAVVSREVYRIVQEGLTNVQRHAGRASTAVRLGVDDGQLTTEIVNGAGAKPASTTGGGRGLEGMRERVHMLGGRFDAGPDDEGWRLSVTVPTGAGR